MKAFDLYESMTCNAVPLSRSFGCITSHFVLIRSTVRLSIYELNMTNHF